MAVQRYATATLCGMMPTAYVSAYWRYCNGVTTSSSSRMQVDLPSPGFSITYPTSQQSINPRTGRRGSQWAERGGQDDSPSRRDLV